MKYLPIINLIALLVIVFYLFQSQKTVKVGFIVNQTAFEQFYGKKEMEEKLKALLESDKQLVDSLENRLKKGTLDEATSRLYKEKLNEINIKEQEFSARFTNNIWSQINQYIKDYGEEHHYDFIYGATGNGSLMYANDVRDLTNEIVIYMNKKYEGE